MIGRDVNLEYLAVNGWDLIENCLFGDKIYQRLDVRIRVRNNRVITMWKV